jgi:hypothetical protein
LSSCVTKSSEPNIALEPNSIFKRLKGISSAHSDGAKKQCVIDGLSMTQLTAN